MDENTLQQAWERTLFAAENLTTSDGRRIKVIHRGKRNYDAGADFSNARLLLGKVCWAGNIEVHNRASDWYRHRHHQDRSYNNVILHIVAQNDRETFTEDGRLVPCLEIGNNLLQGAEVQEKKWCKLSPKRFLSQTSLFAAERMKQKAHEIDEWYKRTHRNKGQTLFILLARGFGLPVNSLPFELLASHLPYKALARQANDLFQLEALLFGQAGMLEESPIDTYQMELQYEFRFLQSKYQLTPMDPSLWKFLRIRPSHFPTIRLAQLAAFIHQHINFPNELEETRSIEEYSHLFDTTTSPYWEEHYRFGKLSTKRTKRMGTGFRQGLLINTVAPLLYFLGNMFDKKELHEKALSLLAYLPIEKNRIVNELAPIAKEANSALLSQGFIHLKKRYCDREKCLMCPYYMPTWKVPL